ncbi:Invasion associated family protein [Rubellimicrobium mesophilum DSM 19309]|uniref:Invasion associated family protein n=1 Tax=Rubellimicrobium mesophilum DSM 19309 TaxID=442562 RepID=A0A017HQI4_9RHOB|nr:invasion associated locus B family protein [Rubellimicrobium mesophilum]EYD76631.1 Invasion associated family protein [Rubellimicrobium mesophilum DSM 19309]
MPISLKPLPVLALLAWTLPLAAQEATTDQPAAEAPAAEAAPAEGQAAAPDAGLSMGETADAASGDPQVGQPYISDTSGDWSLRCLRTEDGNDPCQLYQLLKDGEGNNVAEISMFPLPEGGQAAAGATIVAPLETLLTENLTLGIDGNEPKRYPFTFCNRAGCVARVGFTAEEIQQFKNGNTAQLTIVPAAAPDQQVNLTISLSGFTAGFEKATVPNVTQADTSGQ